MDILDKLRDLHAQATTERTHYYVASCCREAIAEIERLRASCSNVGLMPDDQPTTSLDIPRMRSALFSLSREFPTAGHLRRASDASLLRLPFMGRKGVQNLRRALAQQTS